METRLLRYSGAEAGTITIEVLDFKPPRPKGTIVMVPSLGRPAQDFMVLANYLKDKGYQCILQQPPGIGRSSLPRKAIDLHELSRGTEHVIQEFSSHSKVTLVGHAFGNRQVRCFANNFPKITKTVVLIACGGMVQPEEQYHQSLLKCFDINLPTHEKIFHIQKAFFSPGNTPNEQWLSHWYPTTAWLQGKALEAVDAADWWSSGEAKVLILQPEHDKIATHANALALKSCIGDRCTIREIPDAGHAALPEQPDLINLCLLNWLEVNTTE